MRILDKTLLSRNEEYMFGSHIGLQVEFLIDQLKLDTYSGLFVVRIIVDKVDDRIPPLEVP